jgi:hypothetical protein
MFQQPVDRVFLAVNPKKITEKGKRQKKECKKFEVEKGRFLREKWKNCHCYQPVTISAD